MKKKLKTIFSLSMAAMLLLQGCGSPKNTQTGFVPKYDKDTEFSLTVAGSYSNFESLEAEFERFYEYYPNVSLNYVHLDDYENTISSALMSDEAPDIFVSATWMLENEKMNSVIVNIVVWCDIK